MNGCCGNNANLRTGCSGACVVFLAESICCALFSFGETISRLSLKWTKQWREHDRGCFDRSNGILRCFCAEVLPGYVSFDNNLFAPTSKRNSGETCGGFKGCKESDSTHFHCMMDERSAYAGIHFSAVSFFRAGTS